MVAGYQPRYHGKQELMPSVSSEIVRRGLIRMEAPLNMSVTGGSLLQIKKQLLWAIAACLRRGGLSSRSHQTKLSGNRTFSADTRAELGLFDHVHPVC